ncbi:MAG: leucine-rich repeat domain-containing protein [Eubacteriaceae bacterium]|nr:leucine-rich repeat domain-containing protein [Eubacteriaceae bacterium]
MSELVIENSVVLSYNGNSPNVEIPPGVMGIATEAFKRNKFITSVSMSKSVRIIGEGAFSGCENLERVSSWGYVTSIGKDAFNGCRSLREVNIPRHLEVLGAFAFYGCRAIRNITLPKSLKEMGKSAFESCKGLTVAMINCDQLDTLPERSFYNCSSLIAASLPRGICKLGAECFSGCRKLEEMNFPEGMVFIGQEAFYDCVGLSSIAITDSETEIGAKAFAGCISLKNALLPPEGCKIGTMAFKDCIGLRDEGGLVCVKGIAYSYYGAAAYYELPEGVTEIGEEAFAGCDSLYKVTLPESVKRIGEYAFRECVNLKSLNIPANLKRLSPTAFDKCCPKEIVMADGDVIAIHDVNMLSFLDFTKQAKYDFNALTENLYTFEQAEVKKLILADMLERRGYLTANSAKYCEDALMRYAVYSDNAQIVSSLCTDKLLLIDPADYVGRCAGYSSPRALAVLLKYVKKNSEIYEAMDEITTPGKCCVLVLFDNLMTVKCNSSMKLNLGECVEVNGKLAGIKGVVVNIVNPRQKSRYRLNDVLKAYRISTIRNMEL